MPGGGTLSNSKLLYYLGCAGRELTPRWWCRRRLAGILDSVGEGEGAELKRRVGYYNRMERPADPGFLDSVRSFREHEKTVYYFDSMEYLRFFDPGLRISYMFGDVKRVPEHPGFVKTRPLGVDNRNSVLLKLNKVRHFNLIRDPYSYESKEDRLVWRGAGHKRHRREFLDRFHDHPRCDVGKTDHRFEHPGQKRLMSIRKQLRYKFIFSIEGNDVGSNLKWIMSSNSVCFMRRPRFESWFMEGALVPDRHYVLIRDDYSDLIEKIGYYSEHPEEAKEIAANARAHVEQFRDRRREDLISLMVIRKYFQLTGQTDQL